MVKSNILTITVSSPPPPTSEMVYRGFQFVSDSGSAAAWGIASTWPNGDTVTVWITLKNSLGQTVALGSSTQTLAPGQNAIFTVSWGTVVPSGTYTWTTFVVDSLNRPISSQVSQSVTF